MRVPTVAIRPSQIYEGGTAHSFVLLDFPPAIMRRIGFAIMLAAHLLAAIAPTRCGMSVPS